MHTYQDYILQQAKSLLSIDSPSGFTDRAADYLTDIYRGMGYEPVRTKKGGVLVDLGGEQEGDAILTAAHIDTLGAIVAEIKSRMAEGIVFEYYDTICRQVANRLPNIKAFASNHDWVYFVAGKKSSNGKMLFEECRKANPNTYFISEANEIDRPLPGQVRKVGVCGATSTPKWLMEEVAARIKSVNKSES